MVSSLFLYTIFLFVVSLSLTGPPSALKRVRIFCTESLHLKVLGRGEGFYLKVLVWQVGTKY